MTGGNEEPAAEMRVVGERVEYIELLTDADLATHEIVDRLDDSRSTVTRALRDLREADLVEKTDGAYTATAAVAMAGEAYREYERTSTAILSSKQLLAPLEPDVDLPHAVLRDATTYLAAERGPFAVLEAVTDEIAEADTVGAYLPSVSNPHLLRVWRGQVAGGEAAVDVTVPPDVFGALRGRYPDLLGEMAAGAFEARRGPGPEYGIVLTESSERNGRTMAVLVYAENGSIHGALQTSRAEAVRWAEDRLADIHAEADEATDELAELAPQSDGGVAQRTVEPPVDDVTPGTPPLPQRLSDEGFVQIADGYFEERSPSSPEVAWRTGLTLADVHAGRAVDRVRETEEGDERLADELRTLLRAGDDCVLLGPPGTGKSTACKQVACEWHDRGHGPVLYRERGEASTFDSPSRLEAHLRQADGHPLVVVEDVVRADASAVFETMAALRDTTEASFLFDAREREWQDAAGTGGTSSFEGPTTPVEVVRMPALSEAECEAFIDRFEADFDSRVGQSGADLLADIRGQDDAADAQRGEGLLVHHLLAARAATVPNEEAPTSVLDAKAREMCEELADADAGATLDVAVLTTLLDAAGLPTDADLLWSLIDAWSSEEVDTAIETLEGRLLFAGDATASSDYRTRHELWATTFLEQLLEVEGEPDARRRFERCANAVFTLADDDTRRQQIKSELDGRTPNLSQILYHATTWADEVAERVFRVAMRNPELTPLFDRTATSGIEVPAACSPETRVRQAFWRGEMYRGRKELEPAIAEHEAARRRADAADGLAPESASELKVRSLARQSSLESYQGAYDTAADHAERAVEVAEQLGESGLLAEAHRNLALANGRQGDLEGGRENLQRALEYAREANDDAIVAHVTALLGTANFEEGNLEKARRFNREALELATETRDFRAAGNAADTLSLIEWERANLERAVRYAERTRNISQKQPSPNRKGDAFLTLGLVACSRGNLDEATEYAERGLELTREMDDVLGTVHHLRLRVRIERYRGDLGDASRFAERARTRADEADATYQLALAEYELATIAVERGDDSGARERFKTLKSTYVSNDRPKLEAKLHLLSARLAYRAGETAEARELLEELTERFREMPLPRKVAACHRLRAAIAADRGRLDAASEHAEQALDVARESGVVHLVGRVAETAGEIDIQRGEVRSARAHYRQAVAAFDRLDNTERVAAVLEKLADACTEVGDGEAATRWSERATAVGDG